MELNFTAKTIAESMDFLKLKYNDQEFTLEEFYRKFNDDINEFALDSLIKKCIITYKGVSMTYEEMCKNITKFADSMELCEIYSRQLYPIEMELFLVDRDYYAAAKLIKAAQEQLAFARYSLIKSQCILDYNVQINWNTGYGGIFKCRCIEANNAIIWYNNVFDSFLQIIFFAFELYKVHPSYSDSLAFHGLLKLCNYVDITKIYGNHKTIDNFKSLWKIIAKAYNANRKVNEWANYLKHKGGISYFGIEAKNPFNIKITMNNSSDTISDTDFEPMSLELDEVIKELQNAHIVLVEALKELVVFIDFDSATTTAKDGLNVVPSKTVYKKVIIT